MKFTKNDIDEIKSVLNDIKTKNVFAGNYTDAIPIVDIETISNNTWLFLRSLLGVGGSECAGILGISPYTNTVKIYQSKFPYLYQNNELSDDDIQKVISVLEEKNPDKSFEDQYILDFGHHMEEFIKEQFLKCFNDKFKDKFEEQFSKKYGKYMEISKVEIYKDSFLYKHPTAPMFADFDYRIRLFFSDGSVEEGIFECKTSSSYQITSKWEDGFPDYYDAQTRHYLAIGNVDFFVIACMADNNAKKFYAHLNFRDEEYEKNLVNQNTCFWNEYVIKHKIPKVDDDVDALDDLLECIEVSNDADSEQKLGKVVFDLCSKRDELKKSISEYSSVIKNLESEIAKIDTQIVQRLNNKPVSVCENNDKKYRITLSNKSSVRFDKNKYLKLYPDDKDKVLSCTNVKESTKMDIKSA